MVSHGKEIFMKFDSGKEGEQRGREETRRCRVCENSKGTRQVNYIREGLIASFDLSLVEVC